VASSKTVTPNTLLLEMKSWVKFFVGDEAVRQIFLVDYHRNSGWISSNLDHGVYNLTIHLVSIAGSYDIQAITRVAKHPAI
jgi:hypothetical protein